MRKVTPAFVAAGVVVSLSLFVLLSMLFYSATDHVERVGELAKEDNVRFHVAHLFFGSVGLGAYVGWMIILAWAVVVFFRESAGDLLLRGISLGVTVLSGAAVADLLGSNHLGGDLGFAVGSVLKANVGVTVSAILLGGIFLASLAFATEFGFYTYCREAHRALTAVPEERPRPADLATQFTEEAAEILRIEEPAPRVEAEAEVAEAPVNLPPPAVEAPAAPMPAPVVPEIASPIETEPMADELLVDRLGEERPLITSSPLSIATEPLQEDLLVAPGDGPAMKSSERIFVREEESPAPPRDFAAGIDLAASASPPAPAPSRAPEITGPVALAEGGFTMPGAVELAEEEEYGTLLDTDIEFYEPMVPERIERVSIEKEPTEPQARWRPALESVFEALVGPAAAPVATRPPPAMTSSFVDDEMFVLDDEIVVFTDEGPAAAPAPVAAAPAPEPGAEDFVADTTMPMRPSAIEEPPAGESPPVEIPPVAAETPVVPEPPAVEAPPPPEPAPAEPRETFTLTAEPASEPFGDEPSPIEVEPTAEAEATPLLPFMQSAAPAAPETPAPPPATVAEKEPRARPLFRRKRPELFAEPATRDPLMDQAAVIFIERGRASVVLLQRRLDIGYTRASRIVESLAKEGLVGPLTESGSREVLMSREEWDRRRGEAAP